jgi:Leucine-rich repeat (LRR) protein
MDGRGLTRLAQLGTLARLARLRLAHNHLTSAAGLGSCFTLETLDLSNNRVSDIGAAAPAALHATRIVRQVLQHLMLITGGAVGPLCHMPVRAALCCARRALALAAGSNHASFRGQVCSDAHLHASNVSMHPSDGTSVRLKGYHSASVHQLLCIASGLWPSARSVHGVAPAASGALAGCRRLQRLDLAGNRLEEVGALQPLTALTLLGVEGNRLATLHGAPPMQ